MNKVVYDSNDNCMMEYFDDASKNDFDRMVKEIEDRGAKLYDEWTIRDNYYRTYIESDKLTQIYFCGAGKDIRLISDPNTTLYCKEPERGTVEPVLYQFENDYRFIDCGMCYIVKCCDGSLFVIDSAHQNSETDHVRMHKLMQDIVGKGKKINIAGWFLSHAHQDHIVKFMDFLREGYDDVNIEMMYYNFPSLNSESANYWGDNDKATMREFETLMAEHKEIPRIKLHTGQHFYIRNLEFYVLSTQEDIFPEKIRRFNNSSTVLVMKVNGATVMWLGDADDQESDILVERYGHFLKSDIVQVAHHGFNGGTTGLYRRINAPVAMFACDENGYAKNKDRATSKKAVECAKEFYLAGDGLLEIKLPYVLGTAKVYPVEINKRPKEIEQ